MTLWDVNLLLHAAKRESNHHAACRRLLQELVDSDQHFAVNSSILAAVVRISTNPRVFSPPASPNVALAFCRALLCHPRAVPVAPGTRHWSIFEDLVRAAGIQGSDTTDAWLAALAIEHGCEWWSADRGFARFPSLRWHNPLGGG